MNSTAVIHFSKGFISIADSTFTDKIGSCIVAIQSVVTLQGHVQFTHNTAHSGAALLLDCPKNSGEPSFLILTNANVTITNNIALHYGGGIAVNPVYNYSSTCFFEVSISNSFILIPLMGILSL